MKGLRPFPAAALIALLAGALAAGGVLLGGCAGPPVPQAPPDHPPDPLHTYSIAARDGDTGDLGVAVQTHWFSVGSVVPWAEAGVGAVATQSFVNPSYGPRGLALMRKGRSAAEALEELRREDRGEAVRQVAMVDAEGRAAAHTGSRCIREASHQVGRGYSVQANMMLSPEVVPAMARAYEEARGDLAERLLAALEAAQSKGGDIRGQQSAALVVVRGKRGAPPESPRLDLRVEDHPRPVEELRRLLRVQQGFDRMRAAREAAGRGEFERCVGEARAAAELAPGNPEVLYWPALDLAAAGRWEEARPLLERVFAAGEHWKELTRRLEGTGVLPGDDGGKRIIEEALKVKP